MVFVSRDILLHIMNRDLVDLSDYILDEYIDEISTRNEYNAHNHLQDIDFHVRLQFQTYQYTKFKKKKTSEKGYITQEQEQNIPVLTTKRQTQPATVNKHT